MASDTDSEFEAPEFMKQSPEKEDDDEFALMSKGDEFEQPVQKLS